MWCPEQHGIQELWFDWCSVHSQQNLLAFILYPSANKGDITANWTRNIVPNLSFLPPRVQHSYSAYHCKMQCKNTPKPFQQHLPVRDKESRCTGTPSSPKLPPCHIPFWYGQRLTVAGPKLEIRFWNWAVGAFALHGLQQFKKMVHHHLYVCLPNDAYNPTMG